MSKKNEFPRLMDIVNRSRAAGAGETLDSASNVLPPPTAAPPPPTDLTVGTMTIGRSSQAPIAIVPLSWRPPGGQPMSSYLVEIADDSGFTSLYLRETAIETSREVQLPTGRTFYARVYAMSASRQSAASASVTITTPADTSSAAQPTSVSAAFIGESGDLKISWTNPASENFRDVEVRIWNSSGKTTLYKTYYSNTGEYIWSADENRLAGSGTPDASVYYELRSRTWGNVLNSTSPPSGTVTKSAPGTPSGLSADFTGPNCVITWTAVAGMPLYKLSIDGVSRDVVGGRFVYTLDQNRVEHSGTPDPVLSLSLTAVDGLDQASSAATATATNAAPSAPASVTLVAGFSAFMVSVTATQPADFLSFRWRIIQASPSAADVTYDSPASLQTREGLVAATYQVGVKVVDVFGQASSETLSSATAMDALTLADLRADAIYRDSDSNTFTPPASGTLAALKDGTTASGGVTYAA